MSLEVRQLYVSRMLQQRAICSAASDAGFSDTGVCTDCDAVEMMLVHYQSLLAQLLHFTLDTAMSKTAGDLLVQQVQRKNSANQVVAPGSRSDRR